MATLKSILEYAVKHGASDVHLMVGSPAACRIDGKIRFFGEKELTPQDTSAYLDEFMESDQKTSFLKRGDADLALSIPGLGRFRVNCLRQRGSVGIVLRHVQGKILPFAELHLPPVMERLAGFRRGLCLVTGTTGSGKSTTLAAIIDRINETRREHIITLEDPIEFLHKNKKGLVTQREINIDTKSFETALRAALREDPDVILIGEMRDAETFQASISAAETGHLVFSTLHTSNAMLTINRILDMFPPEQHAQVRTQLSLQLKACVAQRLVPLADGNGRVPAIEVMLMNPGLAQLIRDNHIKQIPNAIAASRDEGMQSFNKSLVQLIQAELISEEIALDYSDSPEELKMNLKGIYLSSSKGGILKR